MGSAEKMERAVALIDGEHYPPVVAFALAELAATCDVQGAVFVGGTEKVDVASDGVYGVPVSRADTPAIALAEAIGRHTPDVIIDLSDEPVVSSVDRMRLASLALGLGVIYRGADFEFRPPRALVTTSTPTLAIIGTGKRVGKTAVSAHVARTLTAGGLDIVVLAMGRGGPAQPELIRGDEVALTTADLLALVAQGRHASSDNYEDAVMARVTTVGCRRCGGGMAGETFFSNVAEGALLADTLGKQLLVLEGSGAAIPPVHADATLLIVGAGQGEEAIRDFFGPYRLGRADAVVIAGAEDPFASAADVAAIERAVAELAAGTPCVSVTLRPAPLEPVAGRDVFFATTAPTRIIPLLAAHLEERYGCRIVAASGNLSDRVALRADLAAAAGTYDVLLTELKAAAIDVVAAAGEAAGVPTVLCDNVPVAVDGTDLAPLIESLARAAHERATTRRA